MPSSPRLTLCGSLSLHPVGTGAAMHMAGYRALGLPFVYVPFQVTDLRGAVAGMRALGIRGCGVSMPFKQEVIALLDALDPQAARIGAVNTVVNDGGQLTGYNTDAQGAARALAEARPLAGSRLLLLGAGGAARAIAHAARDAGALVTIANRDLDKARALAAGTGAAAAGLDEAVRAGAYDVVVNATSVGMREVDPGAPCPRPPSAPARWSWTSSTSPWRPSSSALRGGVAPSPCTAGGLLHQAARQFELYTGRAAPLDAMENALAEQLRAPPA